MLWLVFVCVDVVMSSLSTSTGFGRMSSIMHGFVAKYPLQWGHVPGVSMTSGGGGRRTSMRVYGHGIILYQARCHYKKHNLWPILCCPL